MFGIFGKQFQALADSVLEPVWSWIIARSWAFRATLIVIMSITIGSWQRPDIVLDLFERTRFAYRVETSASQIIPFSSRTEARLNRTLGRLGDVIENDLLPESRHNMTAWSASQTLVAAQSLGKEPDDPDAFVDLIRRTRVPSCFCWTELPADRHHAPGLHISGWVMTALAGMERGLELDELTSLLALQSMDGSWTIFAAADQNGWASTYATAWMTLGLHRQLKAGLVPPSLKSRVKSSVRRGTSWLLQNRENGRWRPYPNRASSSYSKSISGFALHVLHQVGAPELVEIDRQWLQQLPIEVVDASSKESPYVEVRTSSGRQFDHFQQLEAPWMLAATADAYGAGNGSEKRRALAWMERSLSRSSFDNADSQPDNWWRAELAIGLAHLEGMMR